MRSIDRIILATDFSEHSGSALEFALELAARFGAEIVVLHVNEAVAVVPGSELAESQQRAAEHELRRTLERVRARNPRARATLRAGTPAVEIVKAAEEEGASLVVMGTRGRTGLSHLLIGSVAERVVRSAPCPVLTVRHAPPEGGARPAP